MLVMVIESKPEPMGIKLIAETPRERKLLRRLGRMDQVQVLGEDWRTGTPASLFLWLNGVPTAAN